MSCRGFRITAGQQCDPLEPADCTPVLVRGFDAKRDLRAPLTGAWAGELESDGGDGRRQGVTDMDLPQQGDVAVEEVGDD
jgi:hypothetical protein